MHGLRGRLHTATTEDYDLERMELLEAKLSLLEEKFQHLEKSFAARTPVSTAAPARNPSRSVPYVTEASNEDLGLTIEQYMLDGL